MDTQQRNVPFDHILTSTEILKTYQRKLANQAVLLHDFYELPFIKLPLNYYVNKWLMKQNVTYLKRQPIVLYYKDFVPLFDQIQAKVVDNNTNDGKKYCSMLEDLLDRIYGNHAGLWVIDDSTSSQCSFSPQAYRTFAYWIMLLIRKRLLTENYQVAKFPNTTMNALFEEQNGQYAPWYAMFALADYEPYSHRITKIYGNNMVTEIETTSFTDDD